MAFRTIKDRGITFRAVAQNDTISGGQLVKAMSLAVLNAASDNYGVDLADAVADAGIVVGLALTNAASGVATTITTEGLHSFTAAGNITPGQFVSLDDTGASDARGVVSNLGLGGSVYLGKALTTARSGQDVAVKLTF